MQASPDDQSTAVYIGVILLCSVVICRLIANALWRNPQATLSIQYKLSNISVVDADHREPPISPKQKVNDLLRAAMIKRGIEVSAIQGDDLNPQIPLSVFI